MSEKAERTEYDRANTLMNTLERGNDLFLREFYNALVATNQDHVVHIMNFKGLCSQHYLIK